MEGIVSVEDSLLLGFGAVGALAGLGLLAAGRNAARASVAFGAVMLVVAGTLAVVGAHALAGAWLFLQAGGTLAAFSFGIQLQNREHPGFVPGRNRILKLVAAIALVVGTAEAARALFEGPRVWLGAPPASLRSVGRVLFTDALLVVELVPLLLASAAVAVLALWRDEEDA